MNLKQEHNSKNTTPKIALHTYIVEQKYVHESKTSTQLKHYSKNSTTYIVEQKSIHESKISTQLQKHYSKK